MSRSFVRSFVALILLLVLIVAALPATAGSSTVPQRQAPGWRELFPTVKPPGRGDHAMAYDVDRGVAVLFGGADSSGYALSDTWEYISALGEWVQRTPAHSPPPRYGHVMVYDEARDVTVLFGGIESPLDPYNDIWLWSGDDWAQVFPTDSPSPRWLAAATYDPQRQSVIVFGGEEPGVGMHGDLWTWGGLNWEEQGVQGPAPRAGAAMAYDRRRHVHVLFGGGDGYDGFNDVWELTEVGVWEEATPPQSPSRRERAEAVYLPQIRRVFLYGGLGFAYLDDSFVWNGQLWATKPFNPAPTGRCCFGMVYDPVLKGALLFGGASFTNELWLFGINP